MVDLKRLARHGAGFVTAEEFATLVARLFAVRRVNTQSDPL